MMARHSVPDTFQKVAHFGRGNRRRHYGLYVKRACACVFVWHTAEWRRGGRSERVCQWQCVYVWARAMSLVWHTDIPEGPCHAAWKFCFICFVFFNWPFFRFQPRKRGMWQLGLYGQGSRTNGKKSCGYHAVFTLHLGVVTFVQACVQVMYNTQPPCHCHAECRLIFYKYLRTRARACFVICTAVQKTKHSKMHTCLAV